MSSNSPPTSQHERPSWDDYFIGIVSSVAERATCNRGRSGAILVYQRQIIATGYVGSPPGFPHCDNVGHHMVNGHCVRTVHAEQNALASAARQGIPILGSTLYSTMVPCRVCAMLLVTAGIDTVVAAFAYPGDHLGSGITILTQAEVQFKQLSTSAAPYGA
jgi:dCMP deaminase